MERNSPLIYWCMWKGSAESMDRLYFIAQLLMICGPFFFVGGGGGCVLGNAADYTGSIAIASSGLWLLIVLYGCVWCKNNRISNGMERSIVEIKYSFSCLLFECCAMLGGGFLVSL